MGLLYKALRFAAPEIGTNTGYLCVNTTSVMSPPAFLNSTVTSVSPTLCAGSSQSHVKARGNPLPESWVGPTSRGVDATREMWAFFRAHRLKSGAGRGAAEHTH